MAEVIAAERFLEIESVERSALGGEEVVVRVRGRWRGRRPDAEPVLAIVDDGGRQHRFAAIPQPRRRIARPGAWTGGFAVPAALVPQLEGRATLEFGEVTIPLPPPTNGEPPTEPLGSEPAGAPEPEAAVGAGAEGVGAPLEDTVEALRVELRERAASEASLRGRLADIEAELRARSATLAHLEPTYADLREEHEHLRELIDRHSERHAALEARTEALEDEVVRLRDEAHRLRSELAAGEVARDAAVGEAAALRAELDRVASELGAAREQLVAADPNVTEAERMLAEARELRTKLSGEQEAPPPGDD